MMAYARSNLSVALMRLTEAQARVESERERLLAEQFQPIVLNGVAFDIKEAIRLIGDALALDDRFEALGSADTLPAPDSETRKVGG